MGGAAGQGLDTIAHLLGKALARDGYRLFTCKDYMSRVRGGHNFSLLRVGEKTPRGPAKRVDLLVALNEETFLLHRHNLASGGRVIYDPERFSLPEEKAGIGIPIPLQELAKEAGGKVMSNTVAVGALLVTLGLDTLTVEKLLEENYAHREDLVRKNINALKAGYDAASAFCKPCFNMPLAAAGSQGEMLFMDGNQVLGMSALASGCRFLSAYPMTPATGIMNYLAGKQSTCEVVVEQAEDEIAAINMALGGSYAGLRSMVSTSGGGFSLMVEGLSLAGMTETPLVVFVAMRPGPATGLPTRTEQGELNFVIHAGHGEFPRAVLSASSMEDAFYRLNKAFELADKYQVPVIFLSDQHFADSGRSLPPFDFSRLEYNRYLVEKEEEVESPYRRYSLTESGVSPRILPGMFPNEVVLVDSDEHSEKGNIIEDAHTRKAMVEKRRSKMQSIEVEMEEPFFYGSAKPDLLLLGWGSTYGALRETVDILLERKLEAALLHFTDLWPLPTREVEKLLPEVEKSFCVEGNSSGQFTALLKSQSGLSVDHRVLKYDGRPFYAEEILEEVMKNV